MSCRSTCHHPLSRRRHSLADVPARRAARCVGNGRGKVDLYFGPTLSLKYDALHIAGTKFLGQISSTPVGFVTAKGSPIAKALSDAVSELIANGDYAKIFDKWGVAGTDEITKSTLNPTPTF